MKKDFLKIKERCIYKNIQAKKKPVSLKRKLAFIFFDLTLLQLYSFTALQLQLIFYDAVLTRQSHQISLSLTLVTKLTDDKASQRFHF